MPFNPTVNQAFAINGQTYRVAGHPAVPTLPYGQEGRMATVYKLINKEREYALKVFKAAYRKPDIHTLSEQLKGFANISGLEVCERHVLDPDSYRTLIRDYPDLSYAVMMPWMDGETWMDILANRVEISRSQSERLAKHFSRILGELETRKAAHCDLSGPNVIVHNLPEAATVFLVDVEQMHAPHMTRPELLLAGTPGYAPRRISDELWSTTADRFAGAVLLAEMLGWHDPQVREMAWAESYFDPEEIQQESERYQALNQALENAWGPQAGELFRQVWTAKTLEACPPFQDWQRLFSNGEVVALTTQEETPEEIEVAQEIEREEKPVEEPDLVVIQYQEYESAIEQAQKENQSVDEYLLKINQLSLQQIYMHLAMAERYRPDEVDLTIAKPFVPGEESGKKLGGFTGGQYTGLLLALPVVAAILLFFIRNQFMHSDLWNLISLPALLSAALYAGLRRKWVATLLYMPVIFIGGLSANTGINALPTEYLFIWVLISGAVLEILLQLGLKIVTNPIANIFGDLCWTILLGWTVGVVLDEGVREVVDKINKPEYILITLAVAAVGWLLGQWLNQIIIQMRERTK